MTVDDAGKEVVPVKVDDAFRLGERARRADCGDCPVHDTDGCVGLDAL